MQCVSSVADEFEEHAEESNGFEYLELNDLMIKEASLRVKNDGLSNFIESSLSNLKLKRVREGGLLSGYDQKLF